MSDAPLDLAAVAARFGEAYDLTPGAVTALAEFLGACRLRTLAKGEALFAEHDLGTDLYLLLQGKIAATRKDPRGQPVRVASLEAPSIVGHMSL
ncbi:MAG: cyclic nucleotide-binding domain-containing protein, partial [Myxococcota bacterium]